MTEDNITSEVKPRDPRALNAYRHGLTGQVLILTPEDQAAYDTHCRGIRESLAPVGAMEADFVQSITDDRWRLKHAGAIENALFAMSLTLPGGVTHEHPEIDAAFSKARSWLSKGDKYALLTLYENRIQRRVEKNMVLLRQQQADRQAALQKAVEEAGLLAQFAASKGETYNIERDFPREALPPQFVFSLAEIARLVTHNRRLAEAKKHLRASQKKLAKIA
jgi:hypothetical protein